MRRANRGRENIPVKSSLLPCRTRERRFGRAFGAPAHVLGSQFVGGDERAALNQRRGLLVQLVQEIAPTSAMR